MKKTALFLTILLMLILSACSGSTAIASVSESSSSAAATSVINAATTVSTPVQASPVTAEFDPEDLDSEFDASEIVTIQLEGDTINYEGSAALVDGSTITITSAGVYSISGTLNDGQVIVDTQDTDKVVLLLNGAAIHSSSSAPIYVRNAEKTIITLASGSENVVSDGTDYVYDDVEKEEPNAAIFSNDDLTIYGSGALAVTANFNNGIASNDDLKITGGSITVYAVNDGIKGSDSLSIKDGVLTINAAADGVQTTNEEDAEKGTIAITGGTLNITSGLDGVQAATSLLISGGEININSGGGSGTSSNTSGMFNSGGRGMEGNANKPADSEKGLKANVDITVTGGLISINSADDALNSNNSITINGGNFIISSGDDGMHADSTLVINDGEITISHSYEGIESADITINGGTIHITSSDDGVNTSGGADGSSINGRPGQNTFSGGNYGLKINGGYLYVDAGGDGLDANGPIEMTDGIVLVNGPTNNGNGPLDYTGTFNISGGFMVAVGSSGMAMTPSATSTQYAAMYNFGNVQASGTLVHIADANGNDVLTFMPSKEYQSVLLSSAALQNGETYTVYSGGSASGTAVDGLFSGTSYSPGTQVASFTITSIITGGGGGMMGGSPGGGRPGGGTRPQMP